MAGLRVVEGRVWRSDGGGVAYRGVWCKLGSHGLDHAEQLILLSGAALSGLFGTV